MGRVSESEEIAKDRELLNGKNVSYVYDLRANILLSKNNAQGAIAYFKKSLRLKPKKRKGFVHFQIAKAFLASNQIDSAIVHQHQALDKFPLKSANDRATMMATLAKYLIVKNELNKAEKWLNSVKELDKLSNQAKALIESVNTLYWTIKGSKKESKDSFIRLETLTDILLSSTNNQNDKKARIKAAIERYRDIINSHPTKSIKSRCEAHIDKFKQYLKGVNDGVKKGSTQTELIAEMFPRSTPKKVPENYPQRWSMAVFFSVLVLALITYKLKYKPKPQKPDDIRRILINEAKSDISRIEQITKTKISEENRHIIALLRIGRTFKEVENITQIKQDTVRKRMSRLAKKANKTDIRHLLT